MKDEFILDQNLVYLNHAAIGPLPKRSYSLLNSAFEGFARAGEASLEIEEQLAEWDELRHSVARLISGSSSGVVITTNTASALHLVADGLYHRFRKGGNIVITDLEFTTNSYVWQQLARRFDLELRVVTFNQTSKKLVGWYDAIDRQTRLVSLSQVQFSNGYRQPLEGLVEYTHDAGGLINLDAIQGLGIVPLDVKQEKVDFLAAGGYKWLLGPLGTGIFYIRSELLDTFESVLVGWFSSRNFRDTVHHPFDPWEDARKYQQSLGPTFGALKHSIELVNGWNPKKSLDHVIHLQDVIVESLQDRSEFTVVSNLEPVHRSGILTIHHENAENLVNRLNAEGIVVAYRDGNIRIAPHRYNTQDDIEKLLDQLRTLSN